MCALEPEITLDEYLEGTEKLQQTEGWKVHHDLERLGWSFYILQGNFHDLNRSLHIDYGTFLRRFDVRNRNEMQDLLKEVMRRFHNFVAAALMLVDHTRNICDKLYKGSAFEKVYAAEINKRFTHNPLVQFVHRLRSYVLHCGLPGPAAVLDSNLEASLRLDIATLREWSGWTQRAREYLDDCKADKKISEIVESYFKTVSDFHDWFLENQKRLHGKEFAEANALRERLLRSKWHTEYT